MKQLERVPNDYEACGSTHCQIKDTCKRSFIYNKRSQHHIIGSVIDPTPSQQCDMFEERKDSVYLSTKEKQ